MYLDLADLIPCSTSSKSSPKESDHLSGAGERYIEDVQEEVDYGARSILLVRIVKVLAFKSCIEIREAVMETNRDILEKIRLDGVVHDGAFYGIQSEWR